MKFNENNYIIIDKYLEGTLDAQEKADVEKRLIVEEELRNELLLQKNIRRNLWREAMRTKLSVISKEVESTKKQGNTISITSSTSSLQKLWRIAASITLIIGLSIVFYHVRDNNNLENLAYINNSSSGTLGGDSDEKQVEITIACNNATDALNEKNKEKVKELIPKLERKLGELAKNKGIDVNRLRWKLALLHLFSHNKDEAQKYLHQILDNNPDNGTKTQVETLLKEIS